jgi:hypothetical protein
MLNVVLLNVIMPMAPKIGHFLEPKIMYGRHNFEHNDTQHNVTQHNDTQHHDTQYNGTQHNDPQNNNKKCNTLNDNGA